MTTVLLNKAIISVPARDRHARKPRRGSHSVRFMLLYAYFMPFYAILCIFYAIVCYVYAVLCYCMLCLCHFMLLYAMFMLFLCYKWLISQGYTDAPVVRAGAVHTAAPGAPAGGGPGLCDFVLIFDYFMAVL